MNPEENLSHSPKPVIDIVYQDDDIIVVNKPAGLLCVPGLSEPENLHDNVKQLFPNARVVHRLDMATSGLVIFALNYTAQRALGKQFEQRQIRKRYQAIVYGQLKDSSGEVAAPIICDWPNRPKQHVDWLKGKPSLTQFHTNAPSDDQISGSTQNNSTRVTLIPITGRTHQLRLHMYHIGHPIIGDNFYFVSKSKEMFSRLCLHAEYLRLQHPVTDEVLEVHKSPDF